MRRFPRSRSGAAAPLWFDARGAAADLSLDLCDASKPAHSTDNEKPGGMMRKLSRFVLVSLGTLLCLLGTAWALGAIYFDLPIAWLRAPLALIYGLAMLVALFFVKGRWHSLGIIALCFAVVLTCWFTIKPMQDRTWQSDVERRAWADIQIGRAHV